MTAHATTHRLRFNDTDRLGHVNNAVFAVMLEQGRSELAVEAGLPVESTGQALVIVRLELDFLREMAWPGDVRVETEVARIGGILLIMGILHAANVVALPVIGGLLSNNKRLESPRPDPSMGVPSTLTVPPLGPGTWILRIEPAPGSTPPDPTP